MTVNTELAVAEFDWTGVETSFAPGFPADKVADVKVFHRTPAGVITEMLAGVNHSVTLATGSKLVTVTPIALPAAPAKVVVQRSTPALVTEVLQDGEGFSLAIIQQLHDRAAMRAGEDRTLFERAIVLPEGGALGENNFDLGGSGIDNLGSGTSPGSAVTYQQMLDHIVSTGNPPPPLTAYASKAVAEAASIPVVMTVLQTAGYAASGDGGRAVYKRVALEPAHAGKFQSVDGQWWEIAENLPNERQFGAVGDDDGVSGTDNAEALQGLIAWAMIDPKRRKITLHGRCYCASDLANFHDVQWEGPGSVRVGTGLEYFVTPTKFNRGFSGVGHNTLHVAPDGVGSAAASGLAAEYPITNAQLMTVLARHGSSVLDRVEFAQGVYKTALNLWNSASAPASLYFRGPAVDAWNNTTPPPDAKAITAIGVTNPATLTVAAHGLSNGDQVFVGLAKKAGGYHEADGAIYAVTATDANTLTLDGVDGSGWSAYTGSGKIYPLKGSRPKAIFYGSGPGAGNGLLPQGNDALEVNDVLFVNWGEKSGTGQDGAVWATQFANVRLYNVHVRDCTYGVTFRDQSTGYWFSGEGCDNRTACFAIDARYTFGTSNPLSTLTTTLLLMRNLWAGDIWEGANGHADGNRLIDNSTDFHIRRNGHSVAIKNEITNTGAIRPSCIIDEGGTAPLLEDNTWVGLFRPYIQRRANSTLPRGGTPVDWITENRIQWPALGAGAGETTLLSINLPRTAMSQLGQGLRARCWNVLGALAGTLTVRAKLDGVTLQSMVIPAGAARHFDFEIEAIANGFDTVRMRYRHTLDDQAGGVVRRLLLSSGAFNTLSAVTVFSVTLQLSDPADSLGAFGFCQIETQGW